MVEEEDAGSLVQRRRILEPLSCGKRLDILCGQRDVACHADERRGLEVRGEECQQLVVAVRGFDEYLRLTLFVDACFDILEE